MIKEYDYIIVGAGHCGLVLAKELCKKNKRVLILEKGGFINAMGSVWPAALFYDKMALAASRQGVTIYRAFGVGGTGVVGCGNAVEFTDEEYERLGLPIKEFIPEAKKEGCVRDEGLTIGPASKRIMEEANKLGYDMRPMPKFSSTGKCTTCGGCVVGCKYGMKWSSKNCLEGINRDRVDLITNFSVKKVISGNGDAIGVEGSKGFKKHKFYSDKIILSAGGIGSPIILQNSGLEAGNNLYIDSFNMTYGFTNQYCQRAELPMSVVCGKFHKSDGFVMAPFVDHDFIGLYTGLNPTQLFHLFRIGRLMGIMTKINDDSIGKVYRNGSIDKTPTDNDLRKLKKGSDIAKEILIKCGVNSKSVFVTKIKGAHPGGTAGIGRVVDKNLETKMKNLYVCDCSVIPFAPGLPPMLALMALTKWFTKNVLE